MPHNTFASDKSTWSIAVLAEFLDERQRSSEALVNARYDADQLAIKNALVSMDKRLEEIQHFRGAMQDQAAHKVERSEFQSEIRAMNAQIESRIDPIEKTLTTLGRPNWGLFVSAASVVLAVIGGCWLLIGLEISVAISPLTLNIEQNKGDVASVQKVQAGLQEQMRVLQQNDSTLGSSGAEASADRARQSQRLTSLEEQFNIQRSRGDTAEARFAEKLTEVETQFYASDQIRNLDTAHVQRMLAVLWHRTAPNEILPTDNSYYPTIGRQAAPTTSAPSSK